MLEKPNWGMSFVPVPGPIGGREKTVPADKAPLFEGIRPAPVLGADVFMPRFGNNAPARPPARGGSSYSPTPKLTYEEFVRSRNVNDDGEFINGIDIIRHLVANRRRLDSEPGPAGYSYGKEGNPGKSYESRYYWALDKELGFRSSNTLDPLVRKLRQADILVDQNKSKPEARLDLVLSEEVVLKFKKEHMHPDALAKLKAMLPKGGGDSDSGKKKEYVDALIDLPWGLQTEDTYDVEAARQLFDERFHGLEQLKSRILQKIAVRQLRGDTRGAIFLLVGPGGTGKTAIAKTIADSLNRNYVRVSLAGVTDANKVNGHSYTYVGSKPGIIIDAMRQAGSMNPVIQLDEIDKTGGNGAHGDPKEALLAVLDPDQNKHFKDSYLEVPFDLSKTIFICTANSLDRFPEHFLSRVEIIEFPAYLEEEKLNIAKKHVIPEKKQLLNIPEDKVVIEDDAILRTIRRFTREGGVRKLSARIVELLEKAGIMIVTQPKKQQKSTAAADQIKIGAVEVDRWLDNPYPIPENVSAEGKIGQVNGLYYSIIGGGRMPIQVSHMPGRGRLTLTGSLRDVMKESAQVVVSYIQTHAGDLGIPKETANKLAQGKLDIHIHYPDTATPKDGPSAGISTFLAVYSALTGKKIPQHIGLTGEIGLHGEVMPIGGVKEKISGAYAQGVTDFILPASNMDQVEDAVRKSSAFANVHNKVRVHYVSTVKEILTLLDDLQTPYQPPVPEPPVSKPAEPETTPEQSVTPEEPEVPAVPPAEDAPADERKKPDETPSFV